MTATNQEEAFRAQVAREVNNALSGISIFETLDEKQLGVVAGYMNVFEVYEGDVVLLEGEQGDYVCFVAKGLLEISKNTPSGERAVITTLPKGRSIGEMAVIDRFPRSATVIALENTRLITLTRGDFDRLLEDHPRLGSKILKGITRLLSLNLRKTSAQLAEALLPIL